MNNLSWLIYAAEVVENLRNLAGVVLFVMGMAGGFGLGFRWVFNVAERTGYRPIWWTALWAAVMIAASTVAVFAPSSRTIYMIAASEAGEAVVTSPEAVEMMGDLKAIIKKRLKDELAPGVGK